MLTIAPFRQVSNSVKEIYRAANVPIEWEEVNVTPTIKNGKQVIPEESVVSIKKNTIALKGELACCYRALYAS